MFVAPGISAAALAAAAMAAVRPNGGSGVRSAIFAAAAITGVVGFGFHLTNTSRRLGGWNSTNVFHGAPVAAPLAITMAGVLGIVASRAAGRRTGVALAGLSAMGIVGTSLEAGALHFRGAFQNPFMYAPVLVPPVAAATLAAAAVTRSATVDRAAQSLLRITRWLGIAGVGFHAWGVHRRMGGWRNWRQNVFAGPPLPAPPAFTGLAIAGLAALDLIETERNR